MKSWNRIAKIKAAILVIVAIAYFVTATKWEQGGLIEFVAPPMFFGFLITFLSLKTFIKKNGKGKLKLTWNDNPISGQNLPSRFQFLGFFLFAAGLAMLAGSGIKFQILNKIGLAALAFGIGILSGILVLSSNKGSRN